MRTTTLFALASVASAVELKADQDPILEDVVWGIEGFKGFYDGFYHDFYKAKMGDDVKNCLNDDTVTEMSHLYNLALHPAQLATQGLTIVSDGMQVFEDVMACHFEKPVFDILSFCQTDEEVCSIPIITENLSKNSFAYIGKAAELAEMMKEDKFPNEDPDKLKIQMRKLGQDAGTVARTLLNYH